MRLRCGAATLLILLAACGSSAAGTTTAGTTTASTTTASTTTGASGPPPREPGCGPRHARTLAFSLHARAYVSAGVVYGCSVPARHRFRLGSLGLLRHSRIEHVAVGGRVAAYGLASMGVDTFLVQVIVRRLTDGMWLASFPATNVVRAESFQSVGSLVVRGDGAVAWIGEVTSIGVSQPRIQVLEARPSDSQGTVLDSGNGIDPASLRLHGSTLSWRDGSTTRHATLS